LQVHGATDVTGGPVPEHLLSLEVMQRLRGLLLPGGILAVNVVGAATGPLSEFAQAVNRTVRAAFEHVRVFRDGPKPGPNGLSNLIFFASAEPVRFEATDSFESTACRDVLMAFERWEVLEAVDPTAPMITDAENPLGRLALPVSEAFREAMNEMHRPEFWIN
jgi:hypothetical protein